jgi:hypothetical protein
MTAPIPSGRLYRMLASVERERGTVIPFPEHRALPAPAGSARPDGPAPVQAAMPPRPVQGAGPSHPFPPRDSKSDTLQAVPSHAAPRPGQIMPNTCPGPFPLPPHVGPFQRRQPDVHVLIEAPQPQPLDPEKLAAIEWARRHRDGWDTFGVALAITAVVLIAARCAVTLFG